MNSVMIRECGADVAVNPYPPLHQAACDGNLAEILICLDELGIPVDRLWDEGFTALHIAANEGRHEVVELLLDRGADIHRRDTDLRMDALESALHNSDERMVRLLLARGARPGPGAALAAAEATEERFLKAKLVQAAGADMSTPVPPYDATPLHATAERGDAEMCRWLLAHGADPAWRNSDGESPADAARLNGHSALAKEIQAAARKR